MREVINSRAAETAARQQAQHRAEFAERMRAAREAKWEAGEQASTNEHHKKTVMAAASGEAA